jgi:thiamine biosynthesis lipoprotein
MEYLEFRAMNSGVLLAAEGDPGQISHGFQAARQLIEDYERRFTRFSADSELTQLNRSAGQWFYASPALLELVRLSLRYFQRTGGLFDPSILPDLKRAGYDRSMDEIRLQGAGQAMKQPEVKKAVFNQILLDEVFEKIWLPPGMEIDLGGIAKGWIAEQAAGVLSKYAPACAANAGGDLYLVGTPAGQSSLEVALEDPRQPDKTLAVLKVGPGAVATSTVTKRSWQQGNKRQHHLIDPRRGEPAVTDWLSVTAIAPQAASAEVFAKALLIAGSAGARELLAKNGEVAFIAVDRQGKLWGTPGVMEMMDANNGTYQVAV